MPLFVCADEFKRPDPNEPFHSLVEIDIYAWIPIPFIDNGDRNHRLKLWFNYNTKKYELVKDFLEHQVRNFSLNGFSGFLSTNIEMDERETIFESEKLQPALDEANRLWNHYHSGWSQHIKEADKECEHAFPNRSSFCCHHS
ncbi:MAG: hypothetical protein ACFFG0_42170 [Candidatus Thorarchaeota archaeon]